MSDPPKKRNFRIEAFKHKVVVDPKYPDKTWKILEHAIHEIYNHNASGLSFEELYRFSNLPHSPTDSSGFFSFAPQSVLIYADLCFA